MNELATTVQRVLHTPMTKSLRLLIPINATERSRWGTRYAIGQEQSGRSVNVALLMVAEPVTSWQVLRFYTQENVRQFQSQRARYLLEDAASVLRDAGVRVETHYREGNVVFEILDLAEQLQCDEIVLPPPHQRWTRLLAPDTVREVMRRRHDIPVTLVNADGTAGREVAHH